MESPVITNPTRMCELLVSLPAVRVLGVVDEPDGPLFVHREDRAAADVSVLRRGGDGRSEPDARRER